jgi:N-acetylglucosaminyldiphosphoundecaprenol N-acetyl-beta-D-mannosaminyltransferase
MCAERVEVLGTAVSAVDMELAIETIGGWIRGGQPEYVCLVPAHSVMAARRDESFRRILNGSGMSTPDGASIVWLLRARGHRSVERVYGPDLLEEVCRASVETGWKHFFYGGSEEVVAALIEVLCDRYPGLRVVGSHAPPFRPLAPEEDAADACRIRDSGADIVWVGIGSPRQERWMARQVGRVGSNVLIGVGAAFDFVSGAKRQAPRWMQRAGLEWLFRLTSEPRRLWPRYSQYPLFVLLAAAELVRGGRRRV